MSRIVREAAVEGWVTVSDHSGSYEKALARAVEHARTWLDSLDERPVGPRAGADELVARFGGPLPEGPTAPDDVVDLLAAVAGPGLMAMPSGRFFGWVIGGTLPAALAADWLVSAWDQNAGLRYATPAAAAAEEAARPGCSISWGSPPARTWAS